MQNTGIESLKEIIKAYKYRLYPTKSQLPLLNQHVGHSRFVYNYFLALKKAKYEETKENISCLENGKDKIKKGPVGERSKPPPFHGGEQGFESPQGRLF